VFTGTDFGDGMVSGLFEVRSNGKGQTIFLTDTGLSGPGCTYGSAAWSRDGARIAFLSHCSDQPSSIQVVNSDLTAARVLVQSNGIDAGPAWSPDGKTVLFGEDGRISAIGSDGRNKRTLTAQLGDYAARFSPDGTRIVFESKRDRNLEIYVMNADGSGQTKLTNDPAGDVSPSWQPLPAGSPPPPPPKLAPSPTPASAPRPPRLGPECHASRVVADFNGLLDGPDLSLDVATVALARCLLTPQERTGDYNTRYALDVRWGPVYKGGSAEGVVPIPDCHTSCRAFGAVDINKDGAAELLLVVDEGASTRFLEVWDLPESKACCTRFDVARPGAPGYPPNQPIRLAYGGSVTHQDAITCDAGAHGSHLLVATHFSLSQDQRTWRARETVFAFDGRSFKVISSRSYTAPVNPAGQSPPPPRGEDCINAQNG
jgi:dipeptidyl aminopeptidase/acylaminoacyl peptidase